MTDRIREHSRTNHAAHGVTGQNPVDSYMKLIEEVAELGQALQDWRRDNCAETRAALDAEIADCTIVIDHILDGTTGRLLGGVVADKVAADRVRLARGGAA